MPTPELADRYARIALGHLTREYPNKLDHVLASGDVGPVRSVDTPELPLSDHRALVITL